MNVIFTDIDGVLTSTLETPGSYLNHHESEYGLSPKCVARLIKLCKDTNSKVVISSNWRKFKPDEKWVNKYGSYENNMPKLKKVLGDLYVGDLPKVRHINKSMAAVLWFEEYSNEIDKFVVFDDDLREGFQNTYEYGIKDNFILTDKEIGLTDEDCKKAKKILNGEAK